MELVIGIDGVNSLIRKNISIVDILLAHSLGTEQGGSERSVSERSLNNNDS